MFSGVCTVLTDRQGNRYYTVEEALNVLEVSRSTFQKLAASLTPYRRARDKKHYYRVEDVESLKQEPEDFWPLRTEPPEVSQDGQSEGTAA